MNWKLKLLLIWTLAVPAFNGFPINYLPGNLLPGTSYGWLTYGAVVYAAIILLLGKKVFKLTIVVALTISVPIVLLGFLISSVGLFIGIWSQGNPAEYITHYTRLFVTMIVVIPLALSMLAVIPFHRLEHHILFSNRGVKISEKIILMSLRVFSHIFHFVIPNILEVVREERSLTTRTLTGGQQSNTLPLSRRVVAIVQVLVSIGVESICSAIRFVPLWAEEISKLPGYTKLKQKTDTTDQFRE